MQIITTHIHTDFDGLASMIAASIVYPDAVPILPKNINPNVKAFMSIHKDLFETRHVDQIKHDDIDSLIIVDVNQWSRLDKMKHLKEKGGFEIILWDHHMGEGDINSTWECVEETGAAVTLLIRELKKQRKLITPIQATLFMIGLYEDTGSLMFQSTTSEDAHAAGYLLENKADLTVISKFLRPAYGEKQKNILFKMLQNAERIEINGYNLSLNVQYIERHIDRLAVVVGMYREILNIDAAFGIFINEQRNKCMIIGRSSLDEFDVGAVMRSMGGGGHPSAGSALLNKVNPDAIKEWIVELIKGNQQSSVQISDVMSFPVYTLKSDVPMKEVSELLRTRGYSGIPVVENNQMVGIISKRDFKKIKRESQLDAPVKAFMKRDVMTIEPGKSPMQAAEIMVKNDIGRLPVFENGKIIGIVTRSDVMMYFYDLLPD